MPAAGLGSWCGVPDDQVDAGRSDLRDVADEQAALRRVAELVAAGASQPSVFDAVAHEACRLLGGHFTALLRYEPDGPAVIAAMWGDEAVRHVMHVGMRLSADGDGIAERVRRAARAERIDSYDGVPGANAATARDLGLTSGVGAPIITEGRVWGAITVLGAGAPLDAGAEHRLEMFARLAGTAIANTQARASLAALADHQAALLRVAERVARGAAPQEIFGAVAAEASQLLDDQPMTLVRYEADRGAGRRRQLRRTGARSESGSASLPGRCPTACGARIASCGSTTTPASRTTRSRTPTG